MKKFLLILCLTSLLFVSNSLAQGTSNVSYFFVACDTQGVVDLTGTMQAGYDVYVQIFNSLGGSGDPISNLVRVSVDGDYQVSATIPYINNTTLLLGQFASAEIRIASESDPEKTLYTGTIDDVADGCASPSYPSTDLFNSGLGTNSTPLVDPVTGEILKGDVISSSGIFTPDGGVLNEVFGTTGQEAIVQIGARPSDIRDQQIPGRTSDPGLIFAECDKYPLSNPGTLFDTDNLVIFWSWFAKTAKLAQDHIDHAQYEVYLSSQYAYRQPFPLVDVSQPVLREDGNYYVFYTANLGDGFRPGHYVIDFYLTWDTAISDGYDKFGPETDNPSYTSTCQFDVQMNPWGVKTNLNNPTVPLQTGG